MCLMSNFLLAQWVCGQSSSMFFLVMFKGVLGDGSKNGWRTEYDGAELYSTVKQLSSFIKVLKGWGGGLEPTTRVGGSLFCFGRGVNPRCCETWISVALPRSRP